MRVVTGKPAPPLRIRGQKGTLSLDEFERQPVVLAFLDRWSPARTAEGDLEAARAELRGLGAVLVLISAAGLFVFRPDDEIERFAARAELDEGDVARAHVAYGVRPRAPALFVIDGERALRFAHGWRDPDGVTFGTLTEALSAAGRALVTMTGAKAAAPAAAQMSRRELVVTSLVAGLTLALLDGCSSPKGGRPAPAGSAAPAAGGPGGEIDVTLSVNGEAKALRVDPRTTLLDALRERLGLMGTKKGCDLGQCGACTVLVDGRRVNACLMLALSVEGKPVTTIEGLARGDELHPVQAAFLSEDAFQCGYCTPGQIMSAVALLKENRIKNDADVREMMSGNICRCGAYTNIVAAINRVRREA